MIDNADATVVKTPKYPKNKLQTELTTIAPIETSGLVNIAIIVNIIDIIIKHPPIRNSSKSYSTPRIIPVKNAMIDKIIMGIQISLNFSFMIFSCYRFSIPMFENIRAFWSANSCSVRMPAAKSS